MSFPSLCYLGLCGGGIRVVWEVSLVTGEDLLEAASGQKLRVILNLLIKSSLGLLATAIMEVAVACTFGTVSITHLTLVVGSTILKGFFLRPPMNRTEPSFDFVGASSAPFSFTVYVWHRRIIYCSLSSNLKFAL